MTRDEVVARYRAVDRERPDERSGNDPGVSTWAIRHNQALQHLRKSAPGFIEVARSCRGSFLDRAQDQRVGLYGRLTVAGLPPQVAGEVAHLAYPRLGYSCRWHEITRASINGRRPSSGEHEQIISGFLSLFEDSCDSPERVANADRPLRNVCVYLSSVFCFTKEALKVMAEQAVFLKSMAEFPIYWEGVPETPELDRDSKQ